MKNKLYYISEMLNYALDETLAEEREYPIFNYINGIFQSLIHYCQDFYNVVRPENLELYNMSGEAEKLFFLIKNMPTEYQIRCLRKLKNIRPNDDALIEKVYNAVTDNTSLGLIYFESKGICSIENFLNNGNEGILPNEILSLVGEICVGNI